jgi:hypothetical protein
MAGPENVVFMLLREIRAGIADVRGEMATKCHVADVRSEVKSLRADVASDLLTLEKRLNDRVNHLNRAVMEYHSSAVGMGC